MKKNIITGIFSLFVFLNCNAQSEVGFFQVEENNHLVLEGFSDGQEFEAYSTPQGGKLIYQLQTDSKGKLHELFSIENTPAFIINRKTSSNPKGNNIVTFLKAKEFVLQNIACIVDEKKCNISWDAETFVDQDITFNIVKSNGTSVEIETINPITKTGKQSYKFEGAYDASVNYKLQVVKNQHKIRYQTSNLNSINPNISIYPTNCHDKLNVVLPTLYMNNLYQIYNSQGQTMLKGQFNQLNSQLDIHQLIPGTYFLQIMKKQEKQHFIFIKN